MPDPFIGGSPTQLLNDQEVHSDLSSMKPKYGHHIMNDLKFIWLIDKIEKSSVLQLLPAPCAKLTLPSAKIFHASDT
jgi:hypothetical protein